MQKLGLATNRYPMWTQEPDPGLTILLLVIVIINAAMVGIVVCDDLGIPGE
jgi:hypothetical protein